MRLSTLTRSVIEAVFSLLVFIAARYLLELATPTQDIAWLCSRLGRLSYYRFPEIVHQWRGWRLLRGL